MLYAACTGSGSIEAWKRQAGHEDPTGGLARGEPRQLNAKGLMRVARGVLTTIGFAISLQPVAMKSPPRLDYTRNEQSGTIFLFACTRHTQTDAAMNIWMEEKSSAVSGGWMLETFHWPSLDRFVTKSERFSCMFPAELLVGTLLFCTR